MAKPPPALSPYVPRNGAAQAPVYDSRVEKIDEDDMPELLKDTPGRQAIPTLGESIYR